MLPIHVGLVTLSRRVRAADLSAAAAAMQVQVTRDFAPLWNVTAPVSAFPALKNLPVGYWPVIIKDDIETPGAGGFHQDRNNQPYALVQYSDTWSLTVSHETLEMLGDPTANRLQGGPSPEDGTTQVQYLVEMCDPCEDSQYAYSIDGIVVSDFITPNFYDAVTSRGARYSFTGAIPGPRQILSGGYISYMDPTDGHMRQQIWPQGADAPETKDLGPMDLGTGSLREWVDSRTAHPELEHGAAREVQSVKHAAARRKATAPVLAARAATLEQDIAAALAG
jgi:hypothetical protein